MLDNGHEWPSWNYFPMFAQFLKRMRAFMLCKPWITGKFHFMSGRGKSSPAGTWPHLSRIYLDIHWWQISFQGRFWFDFCPFSVDLPISKWKWQLKEKNATSCLHFWVMMNLPGNFQKNRHIFTQSRVRSPQKDPKGTKSKIYHSSQKIAISSSFTRNPP